jgi:hypothetical protein
MLSSRLNQLIKSRHSSRSFAASRLRAQKNARIASSQFLFPRSFQDSGLNGYAIHASGHTITGEFNFPLTGLTTVAPSPAQFTKPEALRFASIAPHNLL